MTRRKVDVGVLGVGEPIDDAEKLVDSKMANEKVVKKVAWKDMAMGDVRAFDEGSSMKKVVDEDELKLLKRKYERVIGVGSPLDDLRKSMVAELSRRKTYEMKRERWGSLGPQTSLTRKLTWDYE